MQKKQRGRPPKKQRVSSEKTQNVQHDSLDNKKNQILGAKVNKIILKLKEQYKTQSEQKVDKQITENDLQKNGISKRQGKPRGRPIKQISKQKKFDERVKIEQPDDSLPPSNDGSNLTIQIESVAKTFLENVLKEFKKMEGEFIKLLTENK